MMRKSMGKFDSFDMARGINILDLVDEIKRANEHINDINEVSYFNDSYIISLKVINE